MKAISPLVATALLLAITIAGGILVYNYVISSITAQQQQYASLSIISAKLIVLENSAVLNIKVANVGTAPAEINNVMLLDDSGTSKDFPVNITVEPGVTKSFNINIDKNTVSTSSEYYVVVSYNDSVTEPYPVTIVR
ncbi:MAG: archaellin/type IV pilin N-terminal domain-containing protein [Thermoprotei archaeon]